MPGQTPVDPTGPLVVAGALRGMNHAMRQREQERPQSSRVAAAAHLPALP